MKLLVFTAAYGRKEGLVPDRLTYISLLQACASVGVEGHDVGSQLHTQVKDLGMEGDVVTSCSLNTHAKCGNLVDARYMCEEFPASLLWCGMP